MSGARAKTSLGKAIARRTAAAKPIEVPYWQTLEYPALDGITLFPKQQVVWDAIFVDARARWESAAHLADERSLVEGGFGGSPGPGKSFLMGPLLWVGGEMLVSMLKKRPLEKPAREKRLLEKRTLEKRTLFQRPILYLGGAAVLLLLLAAPWYLSRAESLVAYARHRFFLGGAEGVNLVGIGRSMGYYLRSFVGQELQLAFGALFAFGLMAALWRGGRANALALAWFGGALGLVSLFSVRDARFMMPAFPAMALLSAAALMGVRGRWGRRALVALASGAAIFQLVVLSYGVGALPAPVNPSRQVAWDAPWGPLVLYSERAHISLPAQPWEWQIRHILNAIAEDRQGFGHGELVVGVIPNRAAFEPATFAYYAEKGGLSLRVIGLGNDPGYATSAMSCHYVIAKSGDQGRPELNRFAESATQDLLAGPLQAHFETLAEYELPDRTTAYLLANLER